ncbi:MAG: amylo-alpha-1,6-glucosidase [Acidobacteriota bacterium]
MMNFDESICTNYAAASSREWLEANGIGGFACGTISGSHIRRYNALLTAATEPPLGRISMLSKYEETVYVEGRRFDLSTNLFPGTVHPEGYKFIKSFRLDPFPIWTYDLGGVILEKRIFMIYGRNATAASWTLLSAENSSAKVALEVRPLLSFVDYHHLQHGNNEFADDIVETGNVITMQPYAAMPPIFFTHNASAGEKSGYWYRDFEYSIEKERGFDFQEDLFQPFVLKFDLAKPAHAIASAGVAVAADIAELEAETIERRRSLVAKVVPENDLISTLVAAADQFIVGRGDGHTVIAGYPWFSDWGRDTMIALNGLALAAGRPEIARDVIVEFSKYISEGMIPNRFPDEGETAEYNTVDATLWYFEAIRAYIAATGDKDILKDGLYSKLVNIINWHLQGTRFDIHVDTDGLLYAGEKGVQLTWMDAKVGDLVITPRTGKPVEIQALWYNALRIMSDLSLIFGDIAETDRFDDMAELCKQNFNAAFWNESEQCLFDVIQDGFRDASIRPNQIFAASLHFSMLDDARTRLVVDKVDDELITPVGLRSLSPRNAKYCPIYTGSPLERDSAYHQGTVWAWLIGGFVDAYVRAYPENTERVDAIIDGFRSQLSEAGIGQVSEIFDGDAPHDPRGCFAQAWSVAELLRIAVSANR